MAHRPLAPPDPQPARLVGNVLRWDRRLGLDFTTAWDDALDALGDLGGLDSQERIGWTTALNQTQQHWRSAWDGLGAPTALDSSLLD